MIKNAVTRILALAALFTWFAAGATAAPPPKPAPPLSSETVQRLAGLAKVWGVAKYFHPYLADRDIDWDAALVKTIPRVEAARTPEEYRAAIDYLFSFLNDPNTHTVSPAASPESATPAKPRASGEPPQPYVHFTADNIAVVTANNYAEVIGKVNGFGVLNKSFEEARKGKAIVLDVRGANSGTEGFADFWFAGSFRESIPLLLDQALQTSSTRHRMYSGYPTQAGGYSGYYGAFVVEDGGKLAAKGTKETRRPIVILIDGKTAGIHDMLGGLQSAGLARIVQEGESGEEPGVEGYPMTLPDGIQVAMRTSEILNPDGSVGFHPDMIVPVSSDFDGPGNKALEAALKLAGGEASPSQRKESSASKTVAEKLENTYASMEFPAEEYRLLTLFRFWNVIHYFYPYQDLFDRPWEETLTEFIPQFEADTNALEYAQTVGRMVTHIQDTHGFVRSPILNNYIGTNTPPIRVQWIEGETVVTYFFDEKAAKAAGLEIGDVVVAVDGEEINARRGRLAQFFAASTPQALRWRVDGRVLAGPKDSTAQLRVRKPDGHTIEVLLARNSSGQRYLRATPVFGVLPSGFGYMDLVRLMPEQVDAAFEAIKDTKAVIIDIRGYPNGVFDLLASRLIDKETIGARFETPTPQGPDPEEISRVKFVQKFQPSAKWKYKGKVLVLINEDAISQSEHTCLILEATAHATFIGTPTNGANGDVTLTVLPGNIGVSFSGHDVRHADGRQLQRLGIQPDITVAPTIAGIRAGRDEVLETAVAYLKRSLPK